MITGIRAFVIVYIVVNVCVFTLYGLDKLKAVRDEWRISERNLIIAAAFGAPGALIAMLLFRHKIRKPKFYIGVPLILIAELIIAYMILNKTAG